MLVIYFIKHFCKLVIFSEIPYGNAVFLMCVMKKLSCFNDIPTGPTSFHFLYHYMSLNGSCEKMLVHFSGIFSMSEYFYFVVYLN